MLQRHVESYIRHRQVAHRALDGGGELIAHRAAAARELAGQPADLGQQALLLRLQVGQVLGAVGQALDLSLGRGGTLQDLLDAAMILALHIAQQRQPILDRIQTGRIELHGVAIRDLRRESVIMRQQQELMELSTPVVRLWDEVLALPLIGTLDSARTQVVMENLLQQVVQTGARIAIIDITGVPTVDTLVAQHLMKTVAATRLMGADCIISGIRPQIAQTIVHLGVNLNDIVTKATLADAFLIALQRLGATVTRNTASTSG